VVLTPKENFYALRVVAWWRGWETKYDMRINVAFFARLNPEDQQLLLIAGARELLVDYVQCIDDYQELVFSSNVNPDDQWFGYLIDATDFHGDLVPRFAWLETMGFVTPADTWMRAVQILPAPTLAFLQKPRASPSWSRLDLNDLNDEQRNAFFHSLAMTEDAAAVREVLSWPTVRELSRDTDPSALWHQSTNYWDVNNVESFPLPIAFWAHRSFFKYLGLSFAYHAPARAAAFRLCARYVRDALPVEQRAFLRAFVKNALLPRGRLDLQAFGFHGIRDFAPLFDDAQDTELAALLWLVAPWRLAEDVDFLLRECATAGLAACVSALLEMRGNTYAARDAVLQRVREVLEELARRGLLEQEQARYKRVLFIVEPHGALQTDVV
jgi:hypothetical protein